MLRVLMLLVLVLIGLVAGQTVITGPYIVFNPSPATLNYVYFLNAQVQISGNSLSILNSFVRNSQFTLLGSSGASPALIIQNTTFIDGPTTLAIGGYSSVQVQNNVINHLGASPYTYAVQPCFFTVNVYAAMTLAQFKGNRETFNETLISFLCIQAPYANGTLALLDIEQNAFLHLTQNAYQPLQLVTTATDALFSGQDVYTTRMGQTLMLLNLTNIGVTQATIANNTLTQNTSTAVVADPRQQPAFQLDSLMNMLGYTNATSMSVQNNTVQTQGPFNGLPANVRAGLVFSQSGQASLVSALSLQGVSPQSQYVASYIQQSNPTLSVFTNDVEIQPRSGVDASSALSRCHYVCRRDCTTCIYTNASVAEWSPAQYTYCFNKTRFEDFTRASHSCIHADLLVTNPTTLTDLFAVAARDPFGGVIRIAWRYSGRGPISFTITQGVTMPLSIYYAFVLDHFAAVASPLDFFATGHVHSILLLSQNNYDEGAGFAWPTQIPFDNRTTTRQIAFEGFDFRIDLSSGATTLNLFSTGVASDPYTSPSSTLDRLAFKSCNFTGLGNTASSLDAIKGAIIDPALFGGPLVAGYYTTLSALGTLSLVDCRMTYIGGIVGAVLGVIPTVSLDQFELVRLQATTVPNGLGSWLVGTGFNVTQTACTGCGGGPQLSGYNNQTYAILQNNQVLLSVGSPTSSTYSVSNTFNLQISGNSASSDQYGLTVQGVSNFPCGVFPTLKNLKILNQGLTGTVADIRCPPDTCIGTACYINPFLVATKCLVNGSFTDILHPLYFNTIFSTWQDCIDICRFGTPRWCQGAPGVYTETLMIRNSAFGLGGGATDSVRLDAYDPTPGHRPLMVGNSHTITNFGSLTTTFAVTLTDLDFFNPAGFPNDTTTANEGECIVCIFSRTVTVLNALTVSRCNFYAILPLVLPASLPLTNLAQWTPILAALRSNTSAALQPSIRTPNIDRVIDVAVHSGAFTLTDTNLYGSAEAGVFVEMDGAAVYTVHNATGENHWGTFLSLRGGTDTTLTYSNCSYYCGALSYVVAATAIVFITMQSTISTRLVITNLTLWDYGNVTTGHPSFAALDLTRTFNFNNRFVMGNPYPDSFGNPLGGLAASLWIQNIVAPTITTLRLRYNTLRGMPLALRMSLYNATIWQLNEQPGFLPIIFDARRSMRETVRWNNVLIPTWAIQGLTDDVRTGYPSDDQSQLTDDVCDQLCLTASYLALSCYVGAAVIPGPTRYTRLCAAINGCPYNSIVMLDAVHTESMVCDFTYTQRNSIPINTLTVLSLVGTTIVGTHQFTQPCPSGIPFIGLQNPTGVAFQNIHFQSTPAAIGQFYVAGGGHAFGCGIPQLSFRYSTFELLDNGSFVGAPVDAFHCAECLFDQISFDHVTWIGSSNYCWRAIDIQTDTSARKPVVVVNAASTDPVPAGAFLSAVQPGGFDIENSTISCQPGHTGCFAPCISIQGSAGFTQETFKLNTIDAGGGTAFEWDLLQDAGFGGMEVLTDGIRLNTVTNDAIGIRITSPLAINNFPCEGNSSNFVQLLRVHNPDVTGTRYDVVYSDAGTAVFVLIDGGQQRVSCFLFRPLPLWSTMFIVFVSIVGTGAAFTVLMVLLCGVCKKPQYFPLDVERYRERYALRKQE